MTMFVPPSRFRVVACAIALFAASCTNGSTSDADTLASASETTAEDVAATASASDAVEPTEDVEQQPSGDSMLEELDAPVHVLATQGPVAEAESYVVVTWDHAVVEATAYEVERDGATVGVVPIEGDPWDDLIFREPLVEAGEHEYRVRAVLEDDLSGPWSDPALLTVLASDDFGRVFNVESFSGSDRNRAQAAIDAASDAGGGVVQFGAQTYVIDDPLIVYGNRILLRGAGEEATTIKVGLPGGDESCGRVTPSLLFQSQLEPLGFLLAAPADTGATELVFTAPPSVEVGDVIAIDGVIGQLPTRAYIDEGIAQDPTIPQDERYPFEAGTVVRVDGNTIELDHPLSQLITTGSELYRYDGGRDNGVELLTVEGISAEDTTYHRLIDVRDQVRFRLADVTARWANRNFLDASGHHLTLVGFTGIEGGAGGYELEACKYKAGFGPATDVVVVDGTFGSLEHDLNMSLLTMQFVYRAVIRSSTFGGSRTYGFNEHGGGSRDLVFENNYVSSGPNSWAGILSGNDTWGFGGELAIRNNRFVDNVNDVLLVENPYGVSIVGNHSSGCTAACIVWSGWGGEHDGHRVIEDESNWGSARLLIADNQIEDAEAGIELGTDESSGFPYEGVRDVVVVGNVVTTSESALAVVGSNTVSGRLWVSENVFSGSIETEDPGADWWFWANTDGPVTTSNELPDWVDRYQEWER